MKRLVLLAITLGLTGCLSKTLGINLGGDGVRMTPEHVQSIKTAGVVSFIAPQPQVHFVASSFKESNIETVVFDGWDATATVTDLLEARLRQKGFKVVSIDAGIPQTAAYTSSASFALPKQVRERLVAAGRAHGVDMLVVVYRQLVKDFLTKSSQNVISYGLYKRHSESETYAYAAVHIEALNTKKGFLMGKADATVKIELDDSAWQQNFETEEGPLKLSPVRADLVREKVLEALSTSIMIAAQEAGITN
jgi:hypothetical protein